MSVPDRSIKFLVDNGIKFQQKMNGYQLNYMMGYMIHQMNPILKIICQN